MDGWIFVEFMPQNIINLLYLILPFKPSSEMAKAHTGMILLSPFSAPFSFALYTEYPSSWAKSLPARTVEVAA
jgi:hypothetical protein